MSRDTIVLLGVNHKTTPLAVREKLALSSGYEEPLRALGQLASLQEFYLLSTCNRMEVLFTCRHPEQACEEVLATLFSSAITPGEIERHVYQYHNDEAVAHLFTVAASLDSMIVGEAQILGQLKEAYRQAGKAGTTGFLLNKLLHKSFSVAKRVRTETRIGASAVSISYAAVELAKKIFGDLSAKKVLLVGAGEMAELAAEHLVGQGVAEVVVANRTLSRAVNLAQCFKGRAVGLEELLDQLEQVDIIISSTGATELILTKDQVRPVMRERRNRPLFFIDIAVPRDLDPKINELDNVYLYDIDDLQSVVELNKSERDKEAIKAARIISEEQLKFGKWLQNMESTPTIIQLREKFEAVVRGEVERTLGQVSEMRDEDQRHLEKMIAAITGKVAYAPLAFLKTQNHCVPLPERIKTVREIFQLDDQGDGATS